MNTALACNKGDIIDHGLVAATIEWNTALYFDANSFLPLWRLILWTKESSDWTAVHVFFFGSRYIELFYTITWMSRFMMRDAVCSLS